MITVIIIEDQKNVGSVMRRMLETRYPDIKVVAVCAYVKEAEVMLNKFHPDLVFLDIELGKSQTCFDLLERISSINFGIIFTTAYSRIAVQALRLNAIDYLLKPIDENELEVVIGKFRNKKSKIDPDKIENLLNAWANPGSQLNKIHLPNETGYDQVPVSDIIFCEAINDQTLFILSNKKKMLINISLKECEDILTPYRFYKIQKSYLVNLNHVKRYNKWKEVTTLLMSNNINLRVSSSLKDKFLTKLKIS
jgi:two-component system LytT family response regulator